MVFAEPTLEIKIEDKMLATWVPISCSLIQWRDKFELVQDLLENRKGLEPGASDKMEAKAPAALRFKTPSKRRIRDTWEEDIFDTYSSIYRGEE